MRLRLLCGSARNHHVVHYFGLSATYHRHGYAYREATVMKSFAKYMALLLVNEFLFALLLTNFHARTLPVAASALMTDRMVLWGELCATSIIIYLPVMLFALLVRNYLVKGLTFGAVNQ